MGWNRKVLPNTVSIRDSVSMKRKIYKFVSNPVTYQYERSFSPKEFLLRLISDSPMRTNLHRRPLLQEHTRHRTSA
jgi:hypothetical protein